MGGKTTVIDGNAGDVIFGYIKEYYELWEKKLSYWYFVF